MANYAELLRLHIMLCAVALDGRGGVTQNGFFCFNVTSSIGIVNETVVQNPCLSRVAYLPNTMALYHKRKIVLTISNDNNYQN